MFANFLYESCNTLSFIYLGVQSTICFSNFAPLITSDGVMNSGPLECVQIAGSNGNFTCMRINLKRYGQCFFAYKPCNIIFLQLYFWLGTIISCRKKNETHLHSRLLLLALRQPQLLELLVRKNFQSRKKIC